MFSETTNTKLELSSEQIVGVKYMIGASYDEGGIALTDVIGTDKPTFDRSGMHNELYLLSISSKYGSTDIFVLPTLLHLGIHYFCQTTM